jgi:hypothetical protein
MRYVWFKDDDLLIEAEEDQGIAACHCLVFNWDKNVSKKCNQKAEEFWGMFRSKGYARVFAALKDTNLSGIKFANKFGFALVEGVRGNLVMKKELYNG